MKTQPEKTNYYKSIFPFVKPCLDGYKEENDGCAIGMGIALAAIVILLFILSVIV